MTAASVDLVGKLFGNHRQRRAGRLAHAQRERAGFASHADDDVPARRSCARPPSGSRGSRRRPSARFRSRRSARCRAAEDRCRSSWGRWRRRCVPCVRSAIFARAVGRVVAADADEIAHVRARSERGDAALERRFVFGRIRARGAQDRAAGACECARRDRTSARRSAACGRRRDRGSRRRCRSRAGRT